MKGSTRCLDGRLMRHDPVCDDPNLETDRGVCPDCNGRGCEPPKVVEFSCPGGAVIVMCFDKPLTDDELKDFHEYIKDWAP